MSIDLFRTTWRSAGEALACLVAGLREDEAKVLLESLSHMTEPPPVMEEAAKKWFSAARNLPPEAAVEAVQVFLHLGWTWNQIGPSTGIILEDLLSLLYSTMEVLSESPGDVQLAHNLVRSGFSWPERFGHILECARIGGGNVVRALDRAKELMPEAIPQARCTLIDFAAGTGWFLLEDEDLPVWRAVARNGELLYRKLRGFSVPVESMKFLAGFLGSLEDTGQMEPFLDDLVPVTVEEIIGKVPTEAMNEVLTRLSTGAAGILRCNAEQKLCTDMLSIKSFQEDPYRSGRALGIFVLFLGGGRARNENMVRVLEFLRQAGPSPVKLTGIAAILEERIAAEPFISIDPETFLRLARITWSFLDAPSISIKRTLNSIRYLIDAIYEGKDISGSVDILTSQLNITSVSPSLVLSASMLLLRAGEKIPIVELLPRCGRLAVILDLLSEEDRRDVLEGVRPQWLSPMTLGPAASLDLIADSLAKVVSKDLRGRFLEKVVTPLLEETGQDDPVFPEFLASAVLTYNRDMTIDQLRDTEMILLRKLFRAEDRTRALGVTMEKLLSIPGIEDNRAGQVVSSARTLCENLSRQAVWLEKTGNRVFSRFLSNGLPDYVRILVEYPEVADMLTGGMAMEILDSLVPSMETQDSQVALWQLRTAAMFFGRIIPLATEILVGSPELLGPYLKEMASLSVSSRHGEPAGVNFLNSAEKSLEKRLILEFERRLGSDSPPEEIPVDISGPVLLESWIRIREQAENLLRSALRNLRPVTLDKTRRRKMAREGKLLVEGLFANGCEDLLAGDTISTGMRKEILRLRKAAGGVDLLDVFLVLEDMATQAPSPDRDYPGARGFFHEHPAPPGENACRHWRRQVFTPLENLLTDILLLMTGKSSNPQMDLLISDFVEITGYLRLDEGSKSEEFYNALERSLSPGETGSRLTVAAAERNLERNVYKLRWRRQATSRIIAAVSGHPSEKRLMKRLFDRMSAEGTIKKQILYVKRYGRLFAAIEANMAQRKKSEYKAARTVLDNIWMFNPAMTASPGIVENAREAVETYVQYFREIGGRTGAVTAPEAGAISLGMRRRYRDNAVTVATLIKWTQDTRKEKLLALVEKHHLLLEAISRDGELTQLMDEMWPNPKARKCMKVFADRPEKLRNCLVKLAGGEDSTEANGLKYV